MVKITENTPEDAVLEDLRYWWQKTRSIAARLSSHSIAKNAPRDISFTSVLAVLNNPDYSGEANNIVADWWRTNREKVLG